MPARAETIRVLAGRVADGAIALGSGIDAAATLSALRALPCIVAWTAQYVAMRALGEPDAFPSGDRVLRRMAGAPTARELERRSEAWRPWRAYAVMLLWQEATEDGTSRRAGVSPRPHPARRTSHAPPEDSGRHDRSGRPADVLRGSG
jgi:AraC family transcriptional regulator of adaptative response / DNA-3-methyladenine glycosylase II